MPGFVVPRDFSSVCPVALSLGSDHGDLRDGTGIPTLSRDNRSSLLLGVPLEAVIQPLYIHEGGVSCE